MGEFERAFKRRSYFKGVIKEIQKVKKLKKIQHSKAVKKLEWPVAIQNFYQLNSRNIEFKNYKSAIIKTIKAGGCNCSRVNFIGAYFTALKGIKSIPKSWIKKTDAAHKILKTKLIVKGFHKIL